MNPELANKIAIWRQAALDGTLSVEDTREAILALRAGRVSASIASDTSRAKKAKVAIPSAEDLLSELGDL
jgi:hypothetical protein